jgi:PAS domain S-box-containing protein
MSHSTIAEGEMDQSLERKALDAGVAATLPVTSTPNDSHILQRIAEGTASKVGPDFFSSLVGSLATTLGVRFAVITEILDDPPTRVRALAVAQNASSKEEIEFGLSGTPTREVLNNGSAFYANNVCGSFPDDENLKTLNVVSYCGLALRDSTGRIIGHLAILDDSPMSPEMQNLPALRIFASRAAAELERQQMERELQESHGKLRTIIEGTSDVIYLQDLRGRYLLINPAGAEALQMTEEQVMGKSDAELFLPEQAQILLEENEMVIESGNTVMNEVTVTLAGETQFFQTNKSPYRDSAGAIVGVIGVCRNITELKRSTERMKITERMASIGTLAAGIAHEINNPLTAIQVSAQTAIDSSQISGGETIVAECLKSINEATEKAGHIVQNVLQFSREGSSIKAPGHVAPIARRVRDLTRLQASAKGISVNLELADELPETMINDLEVEQALINVVLNAIEASTDGMTVNVSISANEEHVKIMVEDRGRGMTQEMASRVFDPFFTTRQGEGGTGLGMSITHAIVQQHKGSIHLRSAPEKGTTVTILFPRAMRREGE